jgi:hypothetical protein
MDNTLADEPKFKPTIAEGSWYMISKGMRENLSYGILTKLLRELRPIK